MQETDLPDDIPRMKSALSGLRQDLHNHQVELAVSITCSGRIEIPVTHYSSSRYHDGGFISNKPINI
jgi:hypothetical protein